MKNTTPNQEETLPHHGFEHSIPILSSDFPDNPDICCNHDCNQGRDCPKRKEGKIMKVFTLSLCMVMCFLVGMTVGQFMLKQLITDDCRILQATRFGEVFIKCATAQKL